LKIADFNLPRLYMAYPMCRSVHQQIGGDPEGARVPPVFQLPTPQSGTLSRILSGTRPSVQTVSDVCLRRICLLDTSAFSALEVLDEYCAI